MVYDRSMVNNMQTKVFEVTKFIKDKINIKNILFILLSFLLSGQTFMVNYLPFSFVMFAVASVFKVPLLLVLISSVLSMLVTSVTSIMILKVVIFFILFTLITALINIEGIGRKYSVFIKFISAITIVELGASFIAGNLFIELFSTVGNLLVTSILYFIFVEGIYVLINLNKGFVYSKEESIAMITVVTIALSIFKNITVFGFSVYNIIVLCIVLIYGWKNGALIGSAAGLVIGLLLTGIADVNMTYVVTLAFSGAIAGILEKFGKVAVVIGFVLGYLYISYYSSGFSELTMRVSEVVIASISLLLVPKSLELKLENLFNKGNTLINPYNNFLDTATDLKSKIGAVSEVFSSLSNIVVDYTKEDAKETRNVMKRYIKEYVDNTCIDCARRKECVENKRLDMTVDYLASKLEHNEVIDKSMFDENCEYSEKIVTDLKEIYDSMKLSRILKQKEKENSIKLSKQYKQVSQILSNVAKNLKNTPTVVDKSQEKLRKELKFYGFLVYEDEYIKDGENIEYTFVTDILTNIEKQKRQIIELASNILEQNMCIKLILNSSKKEKSKIKIVSKPEYDIATSVTNDIKSGENVSGDSYITMELQDLKYMCALSDGAGSGDSASKSSTTVINMLEKLLAGGFDDKKAIDIINSTLKLKGDDTNFSTLDILLINEKNAQAEFIKIGSAPTYILEDGKVTVINNLNLPVGLLNNTDYVPIVKKLKDNSIVIQLTDGVINENMNINKNYITEYLTSLDITKNTRMISDEMHKLVLRENKNNLNDDFTIIVTKVHKVRS